MVFPMVKFFIDPPEQELHPMFVEVTLVRSNLGFVPEKSVAHSMYLLL